MKHGSLCQLRRHNSRALLNYIRLELSTKNRPDNVIAPRPNFHAMASQQSLGRNGKWLLPSFCSLYFFGEEGTELNFRLNFRSNNFFNTLPVIQRERGIYASCAFLSQHFYNLKIIIRYETCEKYRKKKYIRVFCFLSYMSIVAVFSNKFATPVKKGRTNVSRWSEWNGGANIYARLFKFDDSKGGAVNFEKQTSRAR